MGDMEVAGDVYVNAKGALVLEGSKIRAGGNAELDIGGPAHIESQVEMHHMESHSEHEASSMFDSDSETHSMSHREKLVAAGIEAGGKVRLSAGGDATFVAAELAGAKGGVQLKGDRVSLLSQVVTSGESYSRSSENMVWQSSQSRGHNDAVVIETKIVGPVTIDAKAGVTVDVEANVNSHPSSVILGRRPGIHTSSSWREVLPKPLAKADDVAIQESSETPQSLSEALSARTDVRYNPVSGSHHSWDEEHSGLSGPGSMLVGGIVTALTAGTASGFAGSLVASSGIGSAIGTGAVSAGIKAAITAGITSTASAAGISAINNKGDLGAVIRDLTKKDAMKALAISMATAGIAEGVTSAVGSSLGIPDAATLKKLEGAQRYAGIAKQVATKTIIKGTVNAAITGKGGKNPAGSLIEDAAGAVALASAHNAIGDVGITHNYADGGLVKTTMHAVAGGAFSAATGGKFAHGAIAGGVAEVAANHLAPVGDEAGKKWVGVIASGTSMLAGGSVKDMGIAGAAAESAVEYNSWGHVIKGAVALGKKGLEVLGKKTAKEGAQKAATEATKEAGKTVAKEASGQAAKTASQASVKKVAGNGANKAAEKTVSKEATKTLTKSEKSGITKKYKAQVKAEKEGLQKLNGNDKKLEKPTHIYKIYDRKTKVVDKFGQSSGKINEKGQSVRAQTQVRQKNKAAGGDMYDSKILKVYPNKSTGTKIETRIIEYTKKRDGPGALPGNKNNR